MTTEILTIGRICELAQAGPSIVSEALARAGVKATLVINDVPHYAADDARKVVAEIRRSADLDEIRRRRVKAEAGRVEIPEFARLRANALDAGALLDDKGLAAVLGEPLADRFQTTRNARRARVTSADVREWLNCRDRENAGIEREIARLDALASSRT